jgi:hypothetical protein
MVNPKEKRKKYFRVLSKLNYECDGSRCTAEQISLRTMNFGQHWRTAGIQDINYSVTLPQLFIIDYINQEMPEYRMDSEKCPDPTDTFEAELKAHGWPSAEIIITIPKLSKLAIEYFAHELLLEWFGAGPPETEPGFILNTIDDFSVFDHLVLFKGKCRRSRPNVAFQDV